jgi:uncharacterized protein
MGTIDVLFDGPAVGPGVPTLVLAHGAGAAMDSPFLQLMAARLGNAGIRVARFEFSYMAARRSGQRPGPDREPVLRQTWKAVLEQLGGAAGLVIGGKSMGGRIASLIADEVGARGLVCLGYPFHPAAKPTVLRTAHLAGLRTPTLIVQGTRDALGSREDVAGYVLSPQIRVVWLPDGDHSFKPRASSGRTERQNLDEAVAVVAQFVRDLA